jgi:hypothetical protein
MTQQPVDLVWNKGLARLCDRRIPDEFPDGLTYTPVATLAGVRAAPELPTGLIAEPARYRDIREGEIVWVRLSWLPSFVRQVLPLVRARFVLVTGDADSSVPSELGDLGRAILASPAVIRWYAQNHDGTAGERIAPIPIGIDFHMQAQQPIWGEAVATPSRQEATLKAIRAELPAWERRAQRVYLDFAWQKSVPRQAPAAALLPAGRIAIARQLSRRAVAFCQGAPLARSEMWRRRGQFAAVLSPHGGGLDCHRTWEALALGHMVVVPSSPLNALFAGLPVVPVEDWRDVTGNNLQRWLSSHQPDGAVHEKLTSRYWLARMRALQ